MQIRQQRAERQNLERLVARAEYDGPVDSGEHCEVLKLWRSARRVPANRVLDDERSVQLITSGWAGWMRRAGPDKRVIFLFLMPGDFIIPGLSEAGCCELISLNSVTTVDASPLLNNGMLTPRSESLIGECGRYYRLLLIDHMTRLASGCTSQAVANLIHEFYCRSERAGACVNGKFELPIGQRVLSCALGRSTVQINKVLKHFQTRGIVRVGYNWVEVLNLEELMRLAGPLRSAALSPPSIITAPILKAI